MSNKKVNELKRRHDRFGLVFMIPWFLGFFLFFCFPFVHSVYLSLHNIDFLQGGGYSATPAGIGNYVEAVSEDANFIKYVASSLLDLLINVPVCLVFAFFVAVLLSQKFHGNTIVKAIFFLPVILGTGVFLSVQVGTADVAGMTVNSAMEEGTGSMQVLQSMNIVKILQDIGVSPELTKYITEPVDRIYSIITMSSVQIFLFLVGLNSVSPSLYEAAHIEGASGWVAFWKITFPMVSPIILVNVVYSIIDNFTMSTNTTMNYIYDVAFSKFNYGLSSAMSWIYCTILTLIVGIAVWIVSKRVVFQD